MYERLLNKTKFSNKIFDKVKNTSVILLLREVLVSAVAGLHQQPLRDIPKPHAFAAVRTFHHWRGL
jgi:hypothetical protein